MASNLVRWPLAVLLLAGLLYIFRPVRELREPGHPIKVVGRIFTDGKLHGVDIELGQDAAEELYTLASTTTKYPPAKCANYGDFTIIFDDGHDLELTVGCCTIWVKDREVRTVPLRGSAGLEFLEKYIPEMRQPQ